MKGICIFIFVFWVSFTTSAQVKVSGQVIDDSNDKPLVGASVYINGSTIGAITNENGEFVFPAVYDGFYDIIASFVGYEAVSYRATILSKNLQITFKLRKKPTELRNVVVLSKDGRQKWLKIFKENFLGVTEAATKCKILNEDEILFEYGNSRDSIKAFSVVPLEIVNKELGYKIYF